MWPGKQQDFDSGSVAQHGPTTPLSFLDCQGGKQSPLMQEDLTILHKVRIERAAQGNKKPETDPKSKTRVVHSMGSHLHYHMMTVRIEDKCLRVWGKTQEELENFLLHTTSMEAHMLKTQGIKSPETDHQGTVPLSEIIILFHPKSHIQGKYIAFSHSL